MSESIRLFAASSLKSALTPLLADFSHQTGVAVDVHYAPAGLLRECIEAGDNCSLFLSANEAHTDALMKSLRALRREVIAHDLLALAVRPEAVTQNRDWLFLPTCLLTHEQNDQAPYSHPRSPSSFHLAGSYFTNSLQ